MTRRRNVAVSGGHGLRGLSATKPGRGRCRCRCRRTPSGGRWGAQHQPRVHALLVRTGGPLCPVQTESGSSPRARACCFSYTYFSNYARLSSHRSHTPFADCRALRVPSDGDRSARRRDPAGPAGGCREIELLHLHLQPLIRTTGLTSSVRFIGSILSQVEFDYFS